MKIATANDLVLNENKLYHPSAKRYGQNAPAGLETFGPTTSSSSCHTSNDIVLALSTKATQISL